MRHHTFRKPVRLHARRSRRKKIWVLGALGVLASTAGLASVLAFAPFFQISSIDIQGAERAPRDQIESRTRTLSEKSYGFLRTRSIALVSTRAIAKTLLEEFPEIETIAVSRDLPRSLALTIQERAPRLLVCEESACVVVDIKGIAFAQKETDNLPRVAMPQAELIQGTRVLSPDIVSFLLKTSDELKLDTDAHMPAVAFTMREEERIEVDTREGWAIVISPTADFSWQFSKLKAVLSKQISPAKRRRLEYIDLRFGDRAFIKYKTP